MYLYNVKTFTKCHTFEFLRNCDELSKPEHVCNHKKQFYQNLQKVKLDSQAGAVQPRIAAILLQYQVFIDYNLYIYSY